MSLAIHPTMSNHPSILNDRMRAASIASMAESIHSTTSHAHGNMDTSTEGMDLMPLEDHEDTACLRYGNFHCFSPEENQMLSSLQQDDKVNPYSNESYYYSNGQNQQSARALVPPFIRALYNILHAEDSKIITWSSNGQAFSIIDQDKLEEHVLPKYFRHQKYASFQRQLNYFGFRKWSKNQSKLCTYSHHCFIRGYPENLIFIKRKPTKMKKGENEKSKTSSSQVKIPAPSPIDLQTPNNQPLSKADLACLFPTYFSNHYFSSSQALHRHESTRENSLTSIDPLPLAAAFDLPNQHSNSYYEYSPSAAHRSLSADHIETMMEVAYALSLDPTHPSTQPSRHHSASYDYSMAEAAAIASSASWYPNTEEPSDDSFAALYYGNNNPSISQMKRCRKQTY